ncbi:MAG: glycosyltransferase family 1 protein [Candidatus Daviesbacteria bacterium]|nr:glycosyltransferase family 1 protein [Candidatus Daviesbacteria bacterium]
MVIGFDASRAFTTNRTGTENYSYQLLKHLSKIDQTNNYHIFMRPQSPDNLQTDEIWPKNFKFITISNKRLWTQLGLAYQTFTDNLDVLFVPSHTLPIFSKPGLKTVVTVHDLGAQFLPKTHQLKQRLYLNFMTHYQIKHASRVIAVSEATKQDLTRKTGISPDKVSVIYEGYNQDLYKPTPRERSETILKKYGLDKDQYFLFVGTIQPRKNLENLIMAFKKYLEETTDKTPRKLILAGSKGWLSTDLYALPSLYHLEDKIQFLGYVADGDLPSLYSNASAFLYPSLFEGFGLPILEAQACGCPVLTSNLSSMREVACLPAGKAGKSAILVDPNSVDDISKGILTLQSESVRQKLIKLGYQNITRFSWEKCARETLKVLELVVSSR